MADPTIYYFTRSFPYGIGEEWKATELRHLAALGRVVVVPYSFDGNRTPRSVDASVHIRDPLFDVEPPWTPRSAVLQVLKSDRRSYFIRELVRSKAFLRRSWLRSWAYSAANLDVLWRRAVETGLIAEIRAHDVLVFFWGRGSCDLLPLLLRERDVAGIVKMHRYDLFLAVNEGYIPFRAQLMDSAAQVLPTSRAGEQELCALYPQHRHKIRKAPLGAPDGPLARPSTDEVLRIFTCSFVDPVKRVELVAKALALVSFKVRWTHAGDGPAMESLRKAIERLPTNIEVELLGWVDTQKVRPLYAAAPVDLFLNVSSSEGVPITVQEALSAGIPVLATDVGGTSDVVNETVGGLLPADLSAEYLAQRITEFRDQSLEEKLELRRRARRQWALHCDSEVHATRFAECVGAFL